MLGVARDADFSVQEIGTEYPGTIQRLAALYRPQVAVVTNVGTDHYTQFKSEEAIAQEKADLVRALPEDGIAVLNADDSRVWEMRHATQARTVSYGIESEGVDYSASNVVSHWPHKLQFDLSHEGNTHRVETKLIGGHFLPNVLASLACAHQVGMALDRAIEAVKNIRPIEGRMSEHRDDSGVRFVRDDYKSPWWGLPFIAEFVEQAEAKRKILVLGEMSDNPGNKQTKFCRFINEVLEHTDLVVVAGPTTTKLNRSLRDHPKVRVCDTIEKASKWLDGYLCEGDLVVLKARIDDHLERVFHNRTFEVTCWRERCGKVISCSGCSSLRDEKR